MCKQSQVSHIMAKAVDDVELIMVPLTLMEKWMMEHRTWYEFVLLTYRTRFEEVLEVVDNIAFRAMDERLEFYLNGTLMPVDARFKIFTPRYCYKLNTSKKLFPVY
jgi:CRP/FNR family transcriptional regulator